MDYLACLRFENGRYDVVFGRDEALVSALAIGAKGAIGSTYNFLAPQFQVALAAFRAGDLDASAAEQAKINEIIQIMIGNGGLPAGKAMMRLVGLDLGPVRLPLKQLDEGAMEVLGQELKAAGFPST
jgi:N-acetylneuraminate lyase